MKVEINRVTKAYGNTRALDDLSLVLEPGKVVALLGANGAGKSTLLWALSGVLKPDRGEVLYDGRPFDSSDLILRRRILFLPDFPPVFAGESVLGNLGMLLRLYEADGGDAPARLVHWLEAFDLMELAEKPIEELSRGQAYKVVLSALLTIDPGLWLLDEPLASGMDPQGLSVLRKEVRAAASRGRTVVFSTQIVEVAERLADVACVLRRGAVCLHEPIETLRRQAGGQSRDVTDGLLDSLRDP